MDSDVSAFPLLDITDLFLGLILNLKDPLCNLKKHFPGVGQHHPLAKTVEELDSVGSLKLLDLLGDGRLRDKEGLCSRAEASLFCCLVENLQLVEVHVITTGY
jgi:hypothetical protein